MSTAVNLPQPAHKHAWNWIDISSQRVGRLTVVAPIVNPEKPKQSFWRCVCDCGRVSVVLGDSLRTGRTQSCGCLKSKSRGILDLAGQRFGKLVAISSISEKNKRVKWLCICDCGNSSKTRSSKLINGETKSCGCLRSDFPKGTKHDLTGRRFSALVAVRVVGRKGGALLWECLCNCGKLREVTAGRLTTTRNRGAEHVRSCGCLDKKAKRERGVAAMNDLIGSYSRAAKTRGRKWEISDESAIELFTSRCRYCGVPPLQIWPHHHVGVRSRYNGTVHYNGIDRVDNDLDYTPSNCVPCCGTCNKLKHKLSQVDFLSAVRRIYEYQTNENHHGPIT